MASSISKFSPVHLKQALTFFNSSINLGFNNLLKKHFVSYYSVLSRAEVCSKLQFFPLCQLYRTVSGVKVKKLSVFSETCNAEEQQSVSVEGKWNTEQKRMLDETVTRDKPPTTEEWQKLRADILGMTGSIIEKNIDALVMAGCIANRKLSIGISYLRFLSSVGKFLNMATAGSFLKLCHVCSEEASVDEDMVLSVYDNLHLSCPLLDPHTAQNAVLGLSLTRRWKESFELLETVKLTATPNALALNAVVSAAFSHNEPDVGWTSMDELLRYGKKPLPAVYLAWLEYCVAQGKDCGVKLLDRLLTYMANNDLRPTRDVAERLKDSYFKLSVPKTKWVGTFTHLVQRGTCKSCGKHLPIISLTSEEFEKLREVFMKQVLIGRNVFLKTSPAELEEFRSFLQSAKPYNIVIDGLNVAFSGTKNNRSPQILAGFVQAVVKHFVAKSKTVLVLGRKHMAKWPRNTMEFVYRNAQVFLAQNLSQDDPFLLYAAMHGGVGTGFVSQDLMRGHAFLLQDPVLKSSFIRWQQQHQYQLVYVDKNGRVNMKLPLQFNPSVQQAGDGSWHIPYDEDVSAQSIRSLDPPTTWLCLVKTKNI